MGTFDDYLEMATTMHRGCACPGQVLGTRMALLGCRLLDIEPPDREKRLFVFVEMDRCFADAIAAVSGCRLGKRTLKYVDYGKAACTFYDDCTRRAVRILARDDARDRVALYAAPEMEKYEAQVCAYRVMPEEALFVVQEVRVELPTENRPGRPVSRVFCARCGEGVNDRREVQLNGQVLCRACAYGSYYNNTRHKENIQINGSAEILGPDDPRYRHIALARRIFEQAPVHPQQPGHAAAARVHKALDKTPPSLAPPASPHLPGGFTSPARRAHITGPAGSGVQRGTHNAQHSKAVFREVLVPVDNSKYSTWAMGIALQIAGAFRSTVVGNHVYAARLHDRRFRDMEPGLPEEYQEPITLTRQRELHDTLIEKGLELISDSYLATLRGRCQQAGLTFVSKTPEGKNYAELVRDIETGRYDLVVMGVRGMGESWRQGEQRDWVLGSVCKRVLRRVSQDVLVVKNDRPLGGTFVVGVDGSDRSFAALRVALALAEAAGARVQAVATYDPFLHKTLFHELEDALTEEARQVFNTGQQQKLHDELIDSGIARIYSDHLETARRIAAEVGMEVETHLLAGKAYTAVLQHVQAVQPTLLALGRTGVHADEGLDIGSNAENLLRLVPCHVLLASRTFTPTWAETRPVVEERLAWTPEALARLGRVPDFARGMARKAIENYARRHGLREITPEVTDAARQALGMTGM